MRFLYKSLPPAEIKRLKNPPGLRGGRVCLIKPKQHFYNRIRPRKQLPSILHAQAAGLRSCEGEKKITLNLPLSNISESASGDKKAARDLGLMLGQTGT